MNPTSLTLNVDFLLSPAAMVVFANLEIVFGRTRHHYNDVAHQHADSVPLLGTVYR